MIKNLINDKVYIGKSYDIKNRWKHGHINNLKRNKHNNKHLQNSWNKYSGNNFKFEIIEECIEDVLSEKEKYWINFYKSHDPHFGYNKTYGGEGVVPTEEIKIKMSKAKIGTKNSFYGKHHTKEAKEKMSKSGKIKIFTELHRFHLNQGQKNRDPIPNEVKEKISNSKLGKKRKPFSEEWKANIGIGGLGIIPWNKGISMQQESKEKMIQSLKKLSYMQELEIKALLEQGISPYKIAPLYNISVSPIYRIKKEMGLC